MTSKTTKKKSPPILLSLPGCDTCKGVKKELKKKKKNVKIVSTSTKKGYDLAIKTNTSLYPQCITVSKKGTPKKCNTKKFLKQFKIKIK